MKKVLVNILNYNGKKFIQDCVGSVLKQNYPNFEIVFIDSNSNDGSLSFLRKKFSKQIKNKKIKVIKLKKNLGFAGGYNYAYRKSKAPYFLLLNNDTKLEDKSLIRKLVQKFESSKEIGSVGCVDIPFNSKEKESKGSPEGSVSIIQTNISDRKQRKEVFYAGGVCCLISKEKTKELFEDEYFAYSEDVYLGFKLKLKNLKNVYEYKTYLLHHGAGTSGRGSPLIRYHSEKNRIRNILYFYEWKTILKIIPLFCLHLIISYTFYILRPKSFFATLKAHFNIISNLFRILTKRKEFQKNRKVSDKELIKLLSSKLFSEDLDLTSFDSINKGFLRLVYFKFTKIINIFSRFYCRLINLKTREFFENEE